MQSSPPETVSHTTDASHVWQDLLFNSMEPVYAVSVYIQLDYRSNGTPHSIDTCVHADHFNSFILQLNTRWPLHGAHEHNSHSILQGHTTHCVPMQDMPIKSTRWYLASCSVLMQDIPITRMVQLPATAAIEYVAACCRTRTRTRTRTKTGTKTKIGTITKIVRGAYARSPQVQCIYAPSRLCVPSIVAWRTKKKQTNSAS